jgi:predicted nucleic-acid-binding protein
VKALDTNLLVRFLVADHAEQSARVRSLFEQAEERREILFVTIPVVLETLWALKAVYEIPRAAILQALEKLSALSFLRFDAEDRLARFLTAAKGSKLDLADLLIGLTAKDHGCSVTLTLDRK